MASKSMASAALFLCFNLFFFAVSSSYVPCPPPPSKGHKHHHHQKSPPSPSTPAAPSCPRDALKLGVCADVLGLVTVVIGSPPKTPCCALLDGLVDLEAAVCLCTALKANVLGLNLNLPVSLSLILNYCGKGVPSGFQCA